MNTVEKDGDLYNIESMNSGLDFEKYFCGRFSLFTNGTKNIESSKMVILFY